MEGVQFIHKLGECNRETESLNAQVNNIQLVIAMLQNELSKADTEEQNMHAVYDAEIEMVEEKTDQKKTNDDRVAEDLTEQNLALELELQEMEEAQTKQNLINKSLNDTQQKIIDKMENQSQKLEQQREDLQKEKEALQVQVRESTKVNEVKQNENSKVEAQIQQLSRKIDVMEDNLDKIVFENVEQFESFHEIIQENISNINLIRNDLSSVQKQHYEMLIFNESIEQRLNQVKGQRDLSIVLTRPGMESELKSKSIEAQSSRQKLVDLMTNTKMSWDDWLVVKLRELDDAMRQASE